MSRQAIIAVVVAAIIILGAGAAFLYSQNKKTAQPATTAAVTSPEPTKNLAAMTLLDILNNKESAKCTFSYSGENGESSGTIYVAQQNARGNFDVVVKGKKTTSNMIKSGDTIYFWGNEMPMGVKMNIPVEELASKMQDNEQLKSVIDPNQKIDYKCTAWTVDNSLFTPPTNIKFISMEGIVPTTSKTTTKNPSQAPKVTGETSGNSEKCAICNQLTGEAKTTCLTQLNCQ
jgi:hypothetical protein